MDDDKWESKRIGDLLLVRIDGEICECWKGSKHVNKKDFDTEMIECAKAWEHALKLKERLEEDI